MKRGHGLRFSQKIVAVFVAVMVFVMLISGVVYYQYSASQIEENFRVSTRDLMNQMNYSLTSQIAGVMRRANSMLTNRTFVMALTNYLAMPSEKNHTDALGTIADFLGEYRRNETLVQSTFIHTALSDFDDFSRTRVHTFNFEESAFAEAYSAEDSLPLQWFPLQRDGIFTRGEWVIPFVWRFSLAEYSGKSYRWQYLVVQISRDALENAVLDSFVSVDHAFVVDSFGNLIIGSEADYAATRESLQAVDEPSTERWETDIRYAGEEYMAMHSSLEVNGWQIYILKNKTEILRSLENLRKLIVETMTILIAVGMGVLVLLIRQMTHSLYSLAQRMQSVREGDLTARFVYPKRDEIGELAGSFNYMLDEIETLMDKQQQMIEVLRQERDRVALMQKQKRKAELRALQAQINPHFLYNTLNTITWQAVASGDEEISQLSHALGRFFRLSLSRGAEVIPVRDEIDHVRNYLLIQQIRYGDKLSYELDADETLCGCPVIKLVLQPLVENAIYHGIKLKEGAGHIRVSVRPERGEDGQRLMAFSVEDDGVGIEPERLRRMNEDLGRAISRQSEGYGIYNVNERIRLYYGEAYGLCYESEPHVGTTVRFLVPVLEWEEDDDDSYPDRG